MGVIYKAVNLENGKLYIGKTVKTLTIRRKQHEKSVSTLGFHGALKKYGLDQFEWHVLFESDDPMVLSQKEIEFIEQYRSFVGFPNCNGYNRTLGGDGATVGDENVSKRLDVREKLRVASSKWQHSDETKRKISEIRTGQKASDETKEKIRLALIGRKMPMGKDHSMAVEYEIIFPDGRSEIIKGLRAFCREHGLNQQLMRRVANGTQESHKGFGCNHVNPR